MLEVNPRERRERKFRCEFFSEKTACTQQLGNQLAAMRRSPHVRTRNMYKQTRPIGTTTCKERRTELRHTFFSDPYRKNDNEQVVPTSNEQT